jgi:hypothetical protein
MESFIIKPTLGLKTNVAENDSSLFKQVGENIFQTYCVEGLNVDYSRSRGSAAKSEGRLLWSNSATADAQTCLGMFELVDLSGTTTHWIFCGDNSSKGRIFRYNGSRDPVRISDVVGHAGATEFAFNTLDLYSIIRFGDYMVFADRAEHTPYCALDDDTSLPKLISGGTEYKFRYLESWQNRILGLYESTTGDATDRLEFRWSNLRPTPETNCTFAAADVLFVPNDDTSTGIKAMGKNACYIYCENSIFRIDYYPNYSIIFGLTPVIDNIGSVNHHGIVDAGGVHYFFNKNYGFCEFNGQTVTPINYDIEDLVKTVRSGYYGHIVGAFLPFKNKIAWTIPLEGSITPNAILYYDRWNKTWERENKVAHFILPMTVTTSLTMQNFIDVLGHSTMASAGNVSMMEYISESPEIAISNTDGKLYYSGGESDAGSAFEGYRVEPIMDFGNPNDKDLLQEIWFDIVTSGNYNIYCQHRGGNTVGECKAALWKTWPEVSCNSVDHPVTYSTKEDAIAYRFHQIKWGTDGANEPFEVSSIELRYVREGRY